MNVMPISEIIEKVTMICKKNNVKRLDLFGSFATGTATPTSDIDFVVYGCDNLMQLEDDLQQIETLRKIDIFDFDSIKNEYLLEDIKKYGKHEEIILRQYSRNLIFAVLVKHSIFFVSVFTFTTLHI